MCEASLPLPTVCHYLLIHILRGPEARVGQSAHFIDGQTGVLRGSSEAEPSPLSRPDLDQCSFLSTTQASQSPDLISEAGPGLELFLLPF